MSETLRNRLIWTGGLVFILLNAVAVAFELYYLMVIPFALAAVAAAFLAIDKLMLFVVFLTPLSITLVDESFNLGVSLPTEPLLAGITLLVLLRLFLGGDMNHLIVRHPITITLGALLTWMLVTTITSARPEISVKYLIAQIWFIVPYYFLMAHIFRNPRAIDWFFWLFVIPLCAVAIYTISIHSQYGFSKETSVWVMWPFFKEHTSYGAVLAMLLPMSVYFVLRKETLWLRGAALAVFGILSVALILSFTRAAWLSVAVAAVVWVLIRWRVKFSILVIAALVGLGSLYSYRVEISDALRKNQQVSSDDLGEHLQSMSNVTTDASNMERINRWTSALRMWEERPHVGWGPGTYMFEYAPFQMPHEKTIISTNAGDQGNAHSEYIGPLAEMGWPGLIFVLVLVTWMMVTGIRAYRKAESTHMAYLALCATLGLITYFTHGFLNNFLNMDKAAAPVWGFAAVIVVIDQFHRHLSGLNQR